MSLAADRPGLKILVVSARLEKNDINGRGLFSLCELRLYLHLDVQRLSYVHGLKGLCHGLLAYLCTAKIYICVTGNLQIMAYFC